MNTILRMLSRIGHDESGATAIEYSLVAALIGISIIGSLQAIANNYITGPMNTVSTTLAR